MNTGSPPARWAPLMFEIMVTDYARSLDFWTRVLGFSVAFTRAGVNFACLERPGGGQMMLYQVDGDWQTGPLDPPLGRGAVLQVYVPDIAPLEASIVDENLPFYVAPREKWRDWGDRLGGQREFLVQDPDGYLVMIVQRLGERPKP